MSMSWPTQSTFCAFYIVKKLIEFGSHWIHIIPGLFMNFFNPDALSGACAGSLLEKIPYAEEKNQMSGIRSLDPYLVKLKRYHLRYLDRYRNLITSKSKYIEKIIKIEITNNSNI